MNLYYVHFGYYVDFGLGEGERRDICTYMGGSGIGWIKTLRKLEVKVYSWALFTLMPFCFVHIYVHTWATTVKYLVARHTIQYSCSAL